MGIDFLASVIFAVAGLGFLLTILPVYNITNQDWYHSAHGFWQHYVIDTGMQFSSFLPIKAIGEVAYTFVMFIFLPFISWNVIRLVLNIVSGGGTRG